MRMKGVLAKTSGAAFCAAALALNPASIATASANLVLNGDFTLTSLSPPGGYICQLGTTCTSNVTDWGSACSSTGECGNGGTPGSLLFRGTGGVAFNNFNGLNVAAPDPPSGNYIAIDGDATYRAPIFQSVGLTAGDSYELQFYQAAAQQGGFASSTTDQWQVSLGAATQLSTLMTVPGGTFAPWTLQTMDFQATSTSEVLSFLALGTPNGVPPIALLADVSLTAVPEPASWAMLLVGFAGLGFAAYRRARGIPAAAEV